MKFARVSVVFLWLLTLSVFAQTAAQPTLPTLPLMIGKTKVTAEVCDEPAERETGMMFREKLEGDNGMLFVMPAPAPAGFWMHNTLIPLSIAYIDPRGVILEIHEMKAKDESIVKSGYRNVAYALEMPKGWFDSKGIMAGDVVRGLPALTGR